MMSDTFMPSPPTHVPPELIVDFDFFQVPDGLSDPAEIWHQLVREGAPKIFYTPRNGGHWVFLDYLDIVEGYRDFQLFSTYQTPIPPIEPFPTMQPQGVDPPQHEVFRMLLAPMFTPVAIRQRTAEIERRSRRIIDSFADTGACDFIDDYATKLPTGMFLHLMGLPEERLPEFLDLSNVFFRSNDNQARTQNLEQIYRVLDAMFEDKKAQPRDDLATKILQARGHDGALLPYQQKLDCAFLLFVAGLDTVTNTMAYIWRYLATTPNARAAMRERLHDPDALMRAVEELFRINAVSNLYRRVTRDTAFRSVVIKRNDRVVLPNTVANRNPAVFMDPDVIDLDRQVNRHVTFGVGPHRCLGSHLAKREVLVSLQCWLERIPEFRLSDEGHRVHAFGGPVMGFRNLPLIWD
jgi:cytochrome P450